MTEPETKEGDAVVEEKKQERKSVSKETVENDLNELKDNIEKLIKEKTGTDLGKGIIKPLKTLRKRIRTVIIHFGRFAKTKERSVP